MNGDGRLDIATGWEEGGVTKIYLNPGYENSKSKWPSVVVGETRQAEDAVFVDLDGDGFLDVVSCTEGNTMKIYVHWAPKDISDILDADKWEQAVLPDSEKYPQKWMFAWPMDVDGKNGVDLVAGSKQGKAQLGWFEAPEDARHLSGYVWHPISPAGWIMSIWQSDMDGDGDLDIVTTDREGSLRGCRWLENPGRNEAQKAPWKNHPMGARDKEVMSMALADIDGDGLEEAVIATKERAIVILKRLDTTGQNWDSKEISTYNFNCGYPRAIAVADINRDGKQDIALTTWRAQNKHGVIWLDHQIEKDNWAPHQISGTEKGIKFDRIELLDMDGDGDLDLLTCEEREGKDGMGVFWYENPFEVNKNNNTPL